MNERVVIVGGGLAGLSAGCYARASGFQTTLLEHNLSLGGVCQAWTRGPYTIDGCIHWLTGGPFDRLYRELGIYPHVSSHTLSTWVRYLDVRSGFALTFERNADAFQRSLLEAAPEDADEIARIMHGIRQIADLAPPPIDRPAELMTVRDGLAQFWAMRGELGTLAHFRKPVSQWAHEHLRSATLQRAFAKLMAGETPTLFLLFTLAYLARGWLSRPDGGTARFRDALVDAYRASGGAVILHATVDEIVVQSDRVCGVRLSDGTMIDADVVISTASTPETTFRLLGGRYGADELRARLAKWKTFEPIVLASYGVSAPLDDVPPTLLLDGLHPFEAGGRTEDKLYVRIANDDPAMAPPGHTVVQAMVPTSYEWWARRGAGYVDAKDQVADSIRARLEECLPAMKGQVTLTDVATPLTYWNMARSWRGAYEGWMPNSESFFGHVQKKLPGLHGLYLAGQWVEPGGGVPTALMSGRQAVQLICAGAHAPFRAPASP
jgi:phytoene dehydrogenase-like protein